MSRNATRDPVLTPRSESASRPVTLSRVCGWYRSTPRHRGIVAAAGIVFVAGWAWNLTGVLR
jgi:hypothetical protein